MTALEIMSELVKQILSELDDIGEAAARLKASAGAARNQTDLEVAILTQQLRTIEEKNANATAFIKEAVSILNKLKKPTE